MAKLPTPVRPRVHALWLLYGVLLLLASVVFLFLVGLLRPEAGGAAYAANPDIFQVLSAIAAVISFISGVITIAAFIVGVLRFFFFRRR